VTAASRSINIEPVCTLPELIWIEDEEYPPAINHCVFQSGTLWAFGQQVLVRSTNVLNWRNVAANLMTDGSFYASSVIDEPAGLRIFARNRNGLRCYRWDEWDLCWKALFSVQTGSHGVFANWTDRGLVMVAMSNDVPDIVCTASASGDSQKWRPSFRGVAVHMQMTSPGVGLCAVWGINNTLENHCTSPSAVYSTSDGGMSWRLAATLETMLLEGAAVDQHTALVGGTGGFLALVDNVGVKELWEEAGGDIAAIDAKGSEQIALIESDDEPAIQNLLSRTGNGPWIRHEARFDERVKCMKLLGPGECIVCTRRVIYRCRFT